MVLVFCLTPGLRCALCSEKRLTFVGEDDIEIEMKVPQDAVKLIIGRQGAVIKQASTAGQRSLGAGKRDLGMVQ